MSLYKYFPSKDDLVLAHLQKSNAQMCARIAQDIDHRTQDPKEKLLAVFDVFDELLSNEEFRGCPFINAAVECANQDNPVQRASVAFYDDFRRSLAGIASKAMLNNPDELSSQLILLIEGAIVTEQMKRHSGAMEVARRAAEVIIENSGRKSDEKMSGDR